MLPELSEHPLQLALHRFRYRDLWPCSPEVFRDFANTRAALTAKHVIYGDKGAAARKPKHTVAPDIAAMAKLELKPVAQRDSGVGDLPPVLTEFIAKLPQANLFTLNLSSVDLVLQMLRDYEPPSGTSTVLQTGGKRKLDTMTSGTLTQARPSVAMPAAPANDMFRQRQRMKAARTS